MKRVTGLGGIFFAAKNPPASRDWYQRHLGIDVQDWGGAAFVAGGGETAVWSLGDGENFKPGTAGFMVNYRVADLHALIAALRDEGCNVLDETSDSEYGKFGWVIDPEGNKIELWEPPPGQ